MATEKISTGKGGRREGAGRKKGSTNKVTAATRERIAATGLTPLDYMLQVLRKEPPEDATEDQRAIIEERRFEAAKAAAPYCHAKIATVEHRGPGPNGEHIITGIRVEFVKPNAGC